MQRDDESYLDYLLRLQAELLLEQTLEGQVRDLLADRQQRQQSAPQGKPPRARTPKPQPPRPPRHQLANGHEPAFRADRPRGLPAPDDGHAGEDTP